MEKDLKFEENKGFYNMEYPFEDEEDLKYFHSNIKDVENVDHKKRYNKTLGYYEYIDHLWRKYKNKYNIYGDGDMITKNSVFDKKFKFKVYSLSIRHEHLLTIKSLPKELLVLYIQGSQDFINFNISIIPKSIVSMVFKWSAFPFNGSDLSHLKKLKYFFVHSKHLVTLPKFPKNIEYIYIRGSSLGFHLSNSLKNFKLKDYPNLKGLIVQDSGIPKSKIPQEWKDAKKQKKLFIKY
jgi:hypothetical protein